jgi:hypothetical protein
MKAFIRILYVFVPAVVLCLSAAGCTGADDTKITKAAPPPPPTEEEKAPPKGMPAGYGKGSTYQEAMKRAATR